MSYNQTDNNDEESKAVIMPDPVSKKPMDAEHTIMEVTENEGQVRVVLN